MSLIASLATGIQSGVSPIAPGLTTTDNPLADFSDTPWWLSLVKALFVFLMINTLLVIWFERRIIGRRQQRPGPNRTGPFGLLQTLADGVKLALKEDLTPKNADKIVFMLAPIIAGAMAFVSFAIIPMGSMVTIFGHRTPLQLTDTPVAVLLVLPVAGVGVYGIVLAGWSSGSTHPLLGGLRATAQVISYEIAMGLRPEEINPFAGGSVPPLLGQRLREPSLQVDQSSAGSAGDPELTEQEATGLGLTIGAAVWLGAKAA